MYQRFVVNGRVCITLNGDLIASGDTDKEALQAFLRYLGK